MEASFASTLERLDRSVARQERILADLRKQRSAIAGRLTEPGIAALDRQLRLHAERVERTLEETRAKRVVVVDLVQKSPELPLEEPSSSSSKRRR